MCNINILIDTNEKRNAQNAQKKRAFMMAVSSVSYETNSDGDGIYSQGKKPITSFQKIDYTRYSDAFFNSDILITHQRYATSGFNSRSVQPFKQDGFIFVHNGVLWGLGNKEKSDSLLFFESFLRRFKENATRKTDRAGAVVQALKESIEDVSGSHSIAIYDECEKSLYYAKNATTNIHFFGYNEFLYITTNELNKVFLESFFKDTSERQLANIEIEDNAIYRITWRSGVAGAVFVKKIVDVKPNYWFNPTVETEKTQQSTLKNEYTDPDTEQKLIVHYDAQPCLYCGILTNEGFTTSLGGRVCSKCSRMEWSSYYG